MATKKSTTAKKSKTPAKTSTVKPAATAPADDKLLVCLQHPFARGTWSLSSTANVAGADGQAAHTWQLQAGFELLAPRIMEGQAARHPVTLAIKGSFQAAPANNAAWANPVRSQTDSANPLRVIVRVNATGKVEVSLAYGVKRAEELRLKSSGDTRAFNGDVAFAANGGTGITVGAVAVVSALPWSLLIGGSDAVVKGLAFDGGWRKNLADGPKQTADGACTTSGSWAFTVMTETEYRDWCAASGRRVDIL